MNGNTQNGEGTMEYTKRVLDRIEFIDVDGNEKTYKSMSSFKRHMTRKHGEGNELMSRQVPDGHVYSGRYWFEAKSWDRKVIGYWRPYYIDVPMTKDQIQATLARKEGK